MSKTLANAIFEAEKFGTKNEKHAALMGMVGGDLRLVKEALDPYRVFNVTAAKTTLPDIYASTDPTLSTGVIDYSKFFDLLDALHNRTITGNVAKASVTAILGMYTDRTATALLRVLNKDLKCGATVSTFEKVYPALGVPKFDLMGAEKMVEPKTAKKGEKVYQWKFPCIGESKYDGQRAIAIVKDGSVAYLSRNGKPLDHLNGLFDADLLKFRSNFGGDFIMDGEALADSFQNTMKARASDGDKSLLKFFCFDFMSLAEWEAQSCLRTQLNRTQALDNMLNVASSSAAQRISQSIVFDDEDEKQSFIPTYPTLVKSKWRLLHNMEQAYAFYNEVLEEGKNADGTMNGLGEGLIIKYCDGLYQWNLGGSRGPEWTKWKPIIDVDGTIVGFENGKHGSKNENKLGALVVEGVDENGNKFRSNVGGLKVSHPKMKPLLAAIGAKTNVQFDKPKLPNYVKNIDQFLRQYIWDNKAEFLGKTIMIEAQEMTLAQNSTLWSLRFPQMCELRTDK